MHKHILFYQCRLAISTVKVRNGAIESSLLGTLLDDLQLVAGGGVALIGVTLVPLLSGLLG